jgi:hypothetical protein
MMIAGMQGEDTQEFEEIHVVVSDGDEVRLRVPVQARRSNGETPLQV